ncbi:MAG: hypothetical protein KF845_03480 [Cyclobacteriaceae bacterium]|nr:hypothetical protein [Cyclobacteriaceae bacterium]
MTVLLLTISVLALFFILMSVRLIFLKNGEFKGTCASQSPFLNKEGATCGYCGKTLSSADQACGDPEAQQKGFPQVKKVKD